MNRLFIRSLYATLAISMVFALSGISDAQKRDDRQIRDAVRSLNSKLDDFEMNARYHLQSTSADERLVSEVQDDVRVVKNVVKQFQDNYDRKRENRDDVNAIADASRKIDDFLAANPQNRQVTDDWSAFHRELDRLAANYGLTIKADDARTAQRDIKESVPTIGEPRPQTTSRSGSFVVGLSGTYSLDTARSENIDNIVSGTNLGTDQKDDLVDKLTPPEQIALDIRGDQVTLASSKASPVNFVADGTTKTENIGGRDVKLRASLANDKLIVSSVGGDTDFTITFTGTPDGRGLKVERRITTDYLSETVFAESVYNKTDSVARLGIDTSSPVAAANPNDGDDLPPVDNTRNTTTGSRQTSGRATQPANRRSNDEDNGGYSDNDNQGRVTNGSSGTYGRNNGSRRNNPNNGTYGRNPGRSSGTYGQPAVTNRPGNYVIPNGVVLTGTLESEINTRASQNGDRFRLTVQTPNEYRGAVIEGYVSNVQSSGRISGNATVTLNFDKITLRDGSRYDFAGNLQAVRDTLGKDYQVDSEGTIRGDSQTRQTAKRGGIGGGIGAVIGAIAGGAHGAVLGAIIGSGAGAGSVAAQGRDDLTLTRDSEITIQSSSPTTVGAR